jgi:hypothetical protein
MGVLGRLFGGPSAGSGPTMATAATGFAPMSRGEQGDGGAWRSVGPMPVTIARFSPTVQTARFESSLTTRSRPTSLAPLVHDRSAQYLSGVVEGIAVAFPAPARTSPPPTPQPAADAPRVGVVQRFTRRRNGFFGAGAAEAPKDPVPDATADPGEGLGVPGPIGQADEFPSTSSSNEIAHLGSPPPAETPVNALPGEPATLHQFSPLSTPPSTESHPRVTQRSPAVASQSAPQAPALAFGGGQSDAIPPPPLRPVIEEEELPAPVPLARLTEGAKLPTTAPTTADSALWTLPGRPETAAQPEDGTSSPRPHTGSTSGMPANEASTAQRSPVPTIGAPATTSGMSEGATGATPLRTSVQRGASGLSEKPTLASPAQGRPAVSRSTVGEGQSFRLRIGAPVNPAPTTDNDGFDLPLPLSPSDGATAAEVTSSVGTAANPLVQELTEPGLDEPSASEASPSVGGAPEPHEHGDLFPVQSIETGVPVEEPHLTETAPTLSDFSFPRVADEPDMANPVRPPDLRPDPPYYAWGTGGDHADEDGPSPSVQEVWAPGSPLAAPSRTAEVTRSEDDEDAHSEDFSHETGRPEATPTLGAATAVQTASVLGHPADDAPPAIETGAAEDHQADRSFWAPPFLSRVEAITSSTSLGDPHTSNEFVTGTTLEGGPIIPSRHPAQPGGAETATVSTGPGLQRMAATHSPTPPTGMPAGLHVGPPPAPDFPAPVSAGPPHRSRSDDLSLVRPLGAVQRQADHLEPAETASANDLAAQRHELTLADKVPPRQETASLVGGHVPELVVARHPWNPPSQTSASTSNLDPVSPEHQATRSSAVVTGWSSEDFSSPEIGSWPDASIGRGWPSMVSRPPVPTGESGQVQSFSSAPTTQLLFDRGPRGLTPPMPIVSGAQTLPVQPRTERTAFFSSPLPTPPPAAETVSAVMVAGGEDDLASAVPVLDGVQRAADGSAEQGAGPAASGGTAQAANGATSSGSSQGGADIDDLSRRIYDRIRDRLKAELYLDRERAGQLSDLTV